jgi:hypothetical protein
MGGACRTDGKVEKRIRNFGRKTGREKPIRRPRRRWEDSIVMDSSVGIALGCGLDDWGSRVRLPAGTGNFSLHHRVQNGSGALPASYPMGTGGSFPGGKAAGP